MFTRILQIGVALAAFASLSLAQRGGGSGPRGQEGQDDAQYATLTARPYQQNRLDRFSELLRLNKDQKNGAKEIFDAAQKEAEPVRDQIQKGRTALATAYLNKQAQPDVDQLVTAYANSLAQMTGIELRAFAKLCESLNPDQQKRVGQIFPMMSGMFSGRDWNRAGN